MDSLPDYLTEQTYEAILQRMLAALPADLDKSAGGFLHDALAPAAIELALAAVWAQQVLERGFAETTFGQYLDLRCQEHGVERRAAVAATGHATFTGTEGSTVPAETRISTASSEGAPAVVFEMTAAGIIAASGSLTVPIEAEEPGVSGNVGAGAITFILDTVPGVTGVSNADPTSGGLATETDASLLARYLQKVRSPSAGGNKADYVNWALEVSGVGGVSVVPVRDGPGTVSIALIDGEKRPASQALIDTVQDYIAPPWTAGKEAEDMALAGYGVSVDDTLEDDTGDSVKMAYDAQGEGAVTHQGLHALLERPGIWQGRARVKVDGEAGTQNLLRIGIWNVSGGAWAKTAPAGEDAVVTLAAEDLEAVFADVVQDFYWNGTDQLELRVVRLQTDTTTTVWFDHAVYRSTFSKDTGAGKAPIGARVTVEPATAVLINVSASLTIAAGYNAESVKSAVQTAIDSYVRSLAFTDENDVRYVRIGQAILDTPGVLDYSELLLNGGTANVAIGPQEVAVLGTVSLT